MKSNPPRWAERFLQWYCNPDLLEEIEGDIYELFDRRASDNLKAAQRRFIWDVMRFFRWCNIVRTTPKYYQSNARAMFKNYVKVGFRNMRKYWVTSSINIFGLSLALGCLITLFIFIDMQLNMDNYHTNAKNIYQVINHVKSEGKTEKWGDSPLLLGPALKQNHSQVKDIFRLEYTYGNTRHGDKVFSELIAFADPAYLKELDYPMLTGPKDVLENKQQIAISYNAAIKYFANEDPIGKEFQVKFNNGNIQSYHVGAVMDKYPYNTSFMYDFIIPIDNFFDLQFKEHYTWDYFTDATFVVLHDGADPGILSNELNPYIDIQHEASSEWKIDHFELISLDGLPLQGHEIRGAVSSASHPAGRVGLGVVAILLTILACFNYMNISIASSTKRLKEIALRKVVGSDRRMIALQFITENMLQVFFAVALGTLISYALFMPGFNYLIPLTVPFSFSSIPTTVSFFLGLLVFVGFISSIYPALYISRFQPVYIFRGSAQFGSKNIFSKVLLGFQFTFAFIAVVACFIFTENALYLQETDWGYESDNIISVQINDETQYRSFRDFAKNNEMVTDFVGTQSLFGRSYALKPVKQLETEIRSNVFSVGANYPSLMNMKLLTGSFFNPSINAENNTQAIVNQKMVTKMVWENPVGQKIKVDSSNYTVVGVVDDFQYQRFFAYEEQLPVILHVTPETEYYYAVFKTSKGQMESLGKSLKEHWQLIAPNDPYEEVIQAQVFDNFFQENKANIIIISFISGIAIILASLGLFGLLAFNIQKRIKEFSVRKVLGARPLHLVKIASSQYIWILIIGFILGAPIGFLLMNQMIHSIYPDPKSIGLIPFILSVLIMIFTISITVIGQVMRATKVNPTENLRNE